MEKPLVEGSHSHLARCLAELTRFFTITTQINKVILHGKQCDVLEFLHLIRHVAGQIFLGGKYFFVYSGNYMVSNTDNIVLFASSYCSVKKIRVCLLLTT